MRGSLQKAKTKRVLPNGEHTWNIILSLGRGADGKYKQKWVRFRGTRRQAEEKLTQLTAEVHRGEFVHSSKLTLGAWLDEWMTKAIRPPRCAKNTYRTYCSAAETHLKPHLGDVTLQRLTTLEIERYYAERGEELKPATVAQHHAILSGALNAAVVAGILRNNPASRASNKPKPDSHDNVFTNVWSAEEASRFLSAARQSGDAQTYALFALALDTGMRRSELLGLRWKDIDGTSVRVERQLLGVVRDEAGEVSLDFATPKGKRARSLDLGPQTVAILREHKRVQAELKLKNRLHYTDHGLVFAATFDDKKRGAGSLGWPLFKTSIGIRLDRLCAVAGVKRITVHGMRHTCATLLMSAGVPANVVQQRLGHRRVEMTLNVYSHVLPAMQADAADRLAALLHG